MDIEDEQLKAESLRIAIFKKIDELIYKPKDIAEMISMATQQAQDIYRDYLQNRATPLLREKVQEYLDETTAAF